MMKSIRKKRKRRKIKEKRRKRKKKREMKKRIWVEINLKWTKMKVKINGRRQSVIS